MPRRPRMAPGGIAYHVLNRAVARMPIFRKAADYAAFERILAEAMQRHARVRQSGSKMSEGFPFGLGGGC